MKTYLTIDMGAGSIRIFLGELSGTLKIEEIHRFDNEQIVIDGHYRWNLPYIEEEIKKGLNKAIQESSVKITSIGIDSWGVDFVLLSKEGIPLELPVVYRDSRTDGMQELWTTYMHKIETFERTGINFYPFNSLFQFLSIKDSEVLRKTDRILFIACYISYFLSGVAVNELSLSSTTQMLNASTKSWDTDILKNLGIELKRFGEPVLAGKIIGKIKKVICPTDINVVITPAHDSASSLVAIPASDNNFAYLSTGTWCVLGTESDTPFISDLAFENGITNEMTHNGKFRPLKNIMGLWLVQQLRKCFDVQYSYSEIECLCSETPSTGLIIDTDDPSFYNPSEMANAFNNYLKIKFNKTLSSPGEFFRCAYESLAASFAKNLKILEALRGREFTSINITGGGCQSKFLCQLTANITGLTVHAGPIEGAIIGNIMVQAMADGTLKNLAEARGMVRKSFDIKIYLPQKV